MGLPRYQLNNQIELSPTQMDPPERLDLGGVNVIRSEATTGREGLSCHFWMKESRADKMCKGLFTCSPEVTYPNSIGLLQQGTELR